MGSPIKSRRTVGVKGSVALLKESIQLGCVSQDYHPRKSIRRKIGKLGSNHTIKFSKGTWHHIKNRERKGPSEGVMQKCEPQDRNPCRKKFEDRTLQETLQQERCARREAWNLATHVYKLKNKGQGHVLLPYRSLGNAGRGRKFTLKEEWENAISGKQLTVFESRLMQFPSWSRFGKQRRGSETKRTIVLSRTKCKAQTDGKTPSKSLGSRGESISGTGGRIACRYLESVRTRHVIIGTIPCVLTTSLNQEEAQHKVEERWCERISCLF